MLISVLRAKLHQIQITGVDAEYEGSLAIDRAILQLAGLREGERVLVANSDNGHRWETYVAATDTKGACKVNGAGARLALKGDRLIVMAFALVVVDEEMVKVVLFESGNKPVVKPS